MKMERSHSFDKLLELKREKVMATVHRICAKRGLPLPTINFEGCIEEFEGQLAHYHPDANTICISERQLIIQNFDDLDATMAHEVSHILIQDHGPRFREEEVTSNIAGWKPPGGIVHITEENEPAFESIKEREIKPDMIRCNYHFCRKKADLTQCHHCQNYYCEVHFEPYEPRLGFHPDSTSNSGHPCAPFVDYLTDKKKAEDKRYAEALGKLVKGKRETVSNDYSYDYAPSFDYSAYNHVKSNNEHEPATPKSNRNWLILLVLVVALFLIYLFFIR